jgi:hypothetical protein
MNTQGEMTVILVGTDQLPRLTETLGSLIAQTDIPGTVVVGDHGSQDHTGDVLSQLPSQTQFLRIRPKFFPRSLPRAAVMNLLCSATRTPVVVIIRRGTELSSHWASRIWEIVQDGAVAVAYADSKNSPTPNVMVNGITSSQVRRCWPDVMALSRAALEAVGGWDPRVSSPEGQRRWLTALAGSTWPIVTVPHVVASAPSDRATDLGDADDCDRTLRILPWRPRIEFARPEAPAAWGYPQWEDSEPSLVLTLAHKAGEVTQKGIDRVVWLADPETDDVSRCRQWTERVGRAIGFAAKIDLWEESYPWETFLSRAASPQNLWIDLGHPLSPLFAYYLEVFQPLVLGHESQDLNRPSQGGDR